MGGRVNNTGADLALHVAQAPLFKVRRVNAAVLVADAENIMM